jgi:hypothetical protein
LNNYPKNKGIQGLLQLKSARLKLISGIVVGKNIEYTIRSASVFIS